jgi:RNA polymerase sigma-70 factor, ECF subfamily
MARAAEVAAVINDILSGDRDAFRRLVDLYALPLRSFLASQVYRLDDVDDLAQEVFIAAYQRLGTFRVGDDFAAWLRGIAHNEVLMYFRSTARRESALGRFRDEVTRAARADLDRATTGDRPDLIERLLRCVAGLPERLRRVVRAELDGDKLAALATEMGTTPVAVYSLHYRANRLLRECLSKGAG